MSDVVTNVNSNDDSILISIKKLLGIMPEVTAFDQDIIIHINTVFSILASVGVGPKTGFRITGDSEVWDSFLSQCSDDNPHLYDDVKTYVYMKVKIVFDPPSSSSLLDSYNNLIKEIEYRMYTESGGY